MVGAGNLSPNAMICVATEEDLKETTEDDAPTTEPPHKDPNEEKRRQLREKHRLEKLNMRAKWKEKKTALKELVATARINDELPDAEKKERLANEEKELKAAREKANDVYVAENERLWLPPEEGAPVRDSCSRTVVGWTVSGGYSYRAGRAVAAGFVPVAAMEEVLSASPDRDGGGGVIVLTREPDSATYRKATMTVVG